MSSLYDPLPARLLPVGPPARSRGKRHSQILLAVLGKSSTAKGSAELSEFAPTIEQEGGDPGAELNGQHRPAVGKTLRLRDRNHLDFLRTLPASPAVVARGIRTI